MNHALYDPDHHEDQNAVTEVGVPDPHQPASRPPRAGQLTGETDALYEGLGLGAYFPSVFGETAQDSQAVQPSSDQQGCGSGPEPVE